MEEPSQQNYQQYPPYQSYSYPGYYGYNIPVKKTTNGLAIASLVLSLVGLMVSIAPIVGIILGFVALSQIKNEPHRYEGKGLAQAGIIIGFIIVGLKVLFIVAYIFIIIFFIGFGTTTYELWNI